MASGTSLMAEEDFLCSICLAVLTRPVSTPCGHNFCLHCITNYWDTVTVLKCPLCNERFHTRPNLRVNVFIAEIAEKYQKREEERKYKKREEEKQHSCNTVQSGNKDVLCDLCTGAKITAVKSCLVCFTSYCQTHLEPHQRISALRKHKLIPPAENLESRICKSHDELLDLFCTVDQKFLCVRCKESEHKSHKVVSLEEEAEKRKTHLGNQKKETDHMIQARQQKILEVQQSLKASGNSADDAVSCSHHVMAAMVDYIQRSHAELTEVIEEKKKKSETEAKVLIDEVEGEIKLIMQKYLQLYSISLSDDPFMFLENSRSLPIDSPKVKDWSHVTLEHGPYTIREALNELQTTVTEEISMLCDPDFKEKQKHAIDVTLDPDTANPSLNISDDLKQVAHSNRKKALPIKPQRFDLVLNVLAKEGFASGKFYYEVQVKDKTQWDLGVANESINRNGDIRLSPKNGYWTIWLRKEGKLTANAGPAMNLHVKVMPRKIGVFVDYEGGQVSFYDVDARANIFSFTGCKFTETLFPFFSPCANDGGKNAAPLIITPVRHNS